MIIGSTNVKKCNFLAKLFIQALLMLSYLAPKENWSSMSLINVINVVNGIPIDTLGVTFMTRSHDIS